MYIVNQVRLLFTLVLLIGVLVGCGNSTETAAPESAPGTPTEEVAAEGADTAAPATEALNATETAPAAYAPQFEPADCPFEIGDDSTYECGYLLVPEDRSQPDGTQIRLAVAIIRSTTPNPQPDPLIYLEGGPGGMALVATEIWAELGYNSQRDVILFDQRGTGYSEPNLNCPEWNDADQLYDGLAACHERLVAEGVNLGHYNSATSAIDVQDLRQALGLADQQFNLLGSSYGTRLALTIMRDYPEDIRSVILDSVYPPNVDSYAEDPGVSQRAFDRFFAGCAANNYCAETYPDLELVFYELLDELDVEPVYLPELDYEVAGADLYEALVQALYDTEAIPYLPLLIYDAYEGDETALEELMYYAEGTLYYSEPDEDSEGMFYSVQCYEELPFTSLEQVTAATADLDEDIQAEVLASFEEDVRICELWNAGVAPLIENAAVNSDIPTLIVAGEYDPVTPPEWGYLAAETLNNHYIYEFPGHGHGISTESSCAVEVALTFLNDPTSPPDHSCLTELSSGPEFE